MDWAAQLLGLSDDFWVASGKGGGVIQVRDLSTLLRGVYKLETI